MTLSTSTTPWQEKYHHGTPGEFVVYSSEGEKVAAVQNRNEDAMAPDAHLITAAPMLYDALKELLLSVEAALHEDGVGCECERCEHAKQAAYRAIGFAEGRTRLKEGMSGTF